MTERAEHSTLKGVYCGDAVWLLGTCSLDAATGSGEAELANESSWKGKKNEDCGEEPAHSCCSTVTGGRGMLILLTVNECVAVCSAPQTFQAPETGPGAPKSIV